MSHADFVHLHVHSAYSLSEGAIKADKIPVLAREALMPAVAITDTANLFGALEFSQACSAKGIQPIIGCQIALSRTDNPRLPPDPVVLLAQDATGLDNLQRLSSAGFLDSDPGLKPQLVLDAVAAHASGLILLTGGASGPLARLLAEGQKPEAERLLARLAEAFPDRVAMELQRHGQDIERAVEPGLIATAIRQYLPTSFQIQRCGACMLMPGLLYITAQWPVMTLSPRFSAASSASGVSVIWWIQIRSTPASAALVTQAAVSSLGSSRTAASTGPGSAPKSA